LSADAWHFGRRLARSNRGTEARIQNGRSAFRRTQRQFAHQERSFHGIRT
jgi:hypothetical protein